MSDDYADHFPAPLATASPSIPLEPDQPSKQHAAMSNGASPAGGQQPSTRGKTSEDLGAYGRGGGPTTGEDGERSWRQESSPTTGRRAPLQDTRRGGVGGGGTGGNGGGGVLTPPGRGASLEQNRSSADTYAYRIPNQPGNKPGPGGPGPGAGTGTTANATSRTTTGTTTPGTTATGTTATTKRDDQGGVGTADAPTRGDASGVLFLLPTAELHVPTEDKLRAKVEKKRAKVPKFILYAPPLKKDDGSGGLLGKGVGAAKGVAGKATGMVIKGESSVDAALGRLEPDQSFTDQLVIYAPSEAKDADLASTLSGLIPAKKQKLPTATSLLASARSSLPLKALPRQLDSSLGSRASAMCFSLEPTHHVFTRPSFYDLPALTGPDAGSASNVTHEAPQGFRALAREVMALVKRETGDGGRWEVEDAEFVGDDLEHYLRLGAQEVVKVATK